MQTEVTGVMPAPGRVVARVAMSGTLTLPPGVQGVERQPQSWVLRDLGWPDGGSFSCPLCSPLLSLTSCRAQGSTEGQPGQGAKGSLPHRP